MTHVALDDTPSLREDDGRARRARAIDAVRSALRGAAAHRGRLVIVRVPAPVAPLDALARAMPERDAAIFSSPGGASLATLGAHVWLEARGRDWSAALRQAVASALASITTISCDGASCRVPRVVGGMAFAPGAAALDPWSALGDAAFALPELTYEHVARGAELSVTCDPAAGGRAISRALQVADLALDVLGREPSPGRRPSSSARVAVTETRESWRERIREILCAIDAGDARKIVAARCARVRCASSIDAVDLLSRLAAEAPGATQVLLRARGIALVGATPEQLVAKRGAEITTMALAGSVDSCEPHPERALRASAKDHREHELVVRGIAGALDALCERVDVAREPSVRALPNVLHLETRIRARAKAGTHILDFVGALHPTAAVAGTPRPAALAWIAAREPEPRGWYAGPFGWIDARGDGELCVTLRSALTRGTDAWVYAGAGIVAGSDPDRELAEGDCKMRPMLRALGVAS